jgi:hypothetical protein
MTGTPDSSGTETRTATSTFITVGTELRDPPDGGMPRPGTDAGVGGEKRRPRALTIVAGVALALFALWGIGSPLVGASSLTPTNEMVSEGPWVNDGFAGSSATNTYLDDTYTSQLPSTILFKQQLGQGHLAEWNPYGSGGSPLAALPDYAFFSPLAVPFYVLPTWLAPAYERLLEVIVAAGGTFLFLRRLSLTRAAALTGGLVYASSGFMVAWLGFPQTRVAAFIPALFWALERFLQLRRARDAVLVALPIAALLLGGFPSVTGYALLTAVAYALVRLISEHRTEWRRLIRPILYLAGSVVAGAALTLFQLIPFLGFYRTWLIEGRGQDGTSHLPLASLLTAVSPWAFGTVNPHLGTQFTLPPNFVESVSYIGAASAVLALVAVAMARQGRALLSRGVWLFLVAASVIWAELIYLGGPPLAVLQHTPGLAAVFSINFIGRARSVLEFLLAVLVAVGFELLVRHRTIRVESLRGRRIWAGCIIVAGAVVAGGLVWLGHQDVVTGAATLAEDINQATTLYLHEMVLGGILVVTAVACVLLLRYVGSPATTFKRERTRRWIRFGGATALIVLIAGQSTAFVVEYYPHSPVNTFYPTTDTHRYLAGNLGDQRYASTSDGMVFGTNTAYDLRSVNGHAFINDNFAALVMGIPDNPIPYPTYIDFAPDPAQASSPVLDLLGAKYFVASPSDPVLGTLNNVPNNGTVRLTPGRPITVPLPSTGPLRGIGFTPTGTIPGSLFEVAPNSWLNVVIRDQNGKQLVSASHLTAGLTADTVFQVALAGESIPAGTQETATITLHGADPLTIDSQGGQPSISTVTDANDGLKIVYVGSTVIYQRLNALPRIRWASQSQFVRGNDARVSLLASGKVPADDVVLSAPGPAASGQPGTVRVTADGTDSVSATVDAQGAGYLVVADADQVGWAASVDGKRADLVSADEGLVAVRVPAGQHTVTLHYALTHGRAAVWLSIATAVLLVAICLAEWLWTRRRPVSPVEPVGPVGP